MLCNENVENVDWNKSQISKKIHKCLGKSEALWWVGSLKNLLPF